MSTKRFETMKPTDSYVEPEEGKGLSEENYTSEEKIKLAAAVIKTEFLDVPDAIATTKSLKDTLNRVLHILQGAAIAIALCMVSVFAEGVDRDTLLWDVNTETTTVGELVSAAASSSARVLPKYLHEISFDSSYPSDAAWYYAQPQDYGHCSAVRNGDTLYRNYDWKFDDAAEFVVRMNAGPGRFASVGIANCGTNLTEAFVTSGQPSRYYKCLPGRTVDGINAKGVVAEVNVVDGPVTGWQTGDGLHPLAAVRWVLDNGTSAQMAATSLVARIKFPSGWTQNFHWMVVDAEETYIVENGAAHKVTGRSVMTNFRLYPSRDTTGAGQERYDLLSGGAAITSAWYTRAYADDTAWTSEFEAGTMSAIKAAWAGLDTKEARRGKGFWQTVHTSVYDLADTTLRVAVQETDDWYTFAVPTPGGIAEETDPVWTGEKAQYAKKTELPTKTSDLTNDSGFIADGDGAWQKHNTFADAVSMAGFDSKVLHAGEVLTVGEMFYVYGDDYGATWDVPFYFVRVSKGGPFDNISNFLFGGPDGYARAELLGNMKPATVTDLAGKLDKAAHELHADSLTNIVWKTCYENGWVFLRAYTNDLEVAQ